MTTTKKVIIIGSIVLVSGTIGYFVYTGIKKKKEEGEAATPEEKPEEKKPEAKLPAEIISKGKQNTTLRPDTTPAAPAPTPKPTTLTPKSALFTPLRTPLRTPFSPPIVPKTMRFSAEGSSWNND